MDDFKFNITTDKDLGKLKITKVKPWCIYFTYDNKYYMLHEEDEYGDEYESEVVLYERFLNNHGNVIKCKPLSSCNRLLNIKEFIDKFKIVNHIDGSWSYNIIYSKIDKIHFVNGLYVYGFNKECIHSNKLKKYKPLNNKKKEILKCSMDSVSYPISLNKVDNFYNNKNKESGKSFSKNTITINKNKLEELILEYFKITNTFYYNKSKLNNDIVVEDFEEYDKYGVKDLVRYIESNIK